MYKQLLFLLMVISALLASPVSGPTQTTEVYMAVCLDRASKLLGLASLGKTLMDLSRLPLSGPYREKLLSAYVHYAEQILKGKSLPRIPESTPTKEEIERQKEYLTEMRRRIQAGEPLEDLIRESLNISEIAPGLLVRGKHKSMDAYVEWIESQDPKSHFRYHTTEEESRFFKEACAKMAVDRLMRSEEEK